MSKVKRECRVPWQHYPAGVGGGMVAAGGAVAMATGAPVLLPAAAGGLALASLSAALSWAVPPRPRFDKPAPDLCRFESVGFVDHELELPADAPGRGEGGGFVPRPGERFALRVFYPAAEDADPPPRQQQPRRRRLARRRRTAPADTLKPSVSALALAVDRAVDERKRSPASSPRCPRARGQRGGSAARRLFGADPGEAALMAPAPAPDKGGGTRYAPEAEWRALSRVAGVPKLPAAAFSHLGQLELGATKGAPAAPLAAGEGAGRPVVVFSHGLTALPAVYWATVSALVRAGFIVACPTHNDGSAATLRLADGTAMPYVTEAQAAAERGVDMADAAYMAAHKTEFEALAWGYRTAQLRRRAAEASHALSFVLSAGGAPAGAADPSRCAFAGHSFGGATALLAAEIDPRAKATACWDPWVQAAGPFPVERLAAGVGRAAPGLLLLCSDWAGGEVEATLAAHACGHPLTRKLALDDLGLGTTGHQSYTDFAVLAPRVLRRLGMVGRAPPRDVLQRVARETAGFLHAAFDAAASSDAAPTRI